MGQAADRIDYIDQQLCSLTALSVTGLAFRDFQNQPATNSVSYHLTEYYDLSIFAPIFISQPELQSLGQLAGAFLNVLRT